MSVKIKSSVNAMKAIKKIGIPQSLYDWLESSAVDVKLTSKEFKFSVPIKGGTHELSVPVSLDDLHKMVTGTLPTVTKISLGKSLAETITTIAALCEDAGEPEADKPAASKKSGGTLGSLPPIKPKTKAATPEPYAGWGTFDLSQMKTAKPVPLSLADRMYQPVSGTSGNSRYYVVAGNQDIRVAARYKDGILSVRVEGPKLEKHMSAICSSGFDQKSGKNYASVHLSVVNDQLAAKSLGALLLGMGVQLDTAYPNLNLIKGA
ncbi:hypothetical protein [Nitratireductor sp. OM-1]|uniref:hypothetical protein n=1 Tax=Nitratireductor sp. OM-1 TaxID=1756988 RepID=UPI0013AEA30C|nr:hypothetical protein [Nitratireductor sp. OM-1]